MALAYINSLYLILMSLRNVSGPSEFLSEKQNEFYKRY